MKWGYGALALSFVAYGARLFLTPARLVIFTVALFLTMTVWRLYSRHNLRKEQATDRLALAITLKRVLDVIGSAFALTLLSPVLMLLAVIVKLDSPGPVLYASKRLGKKGRVFSCYKFRTMVADRQEVKLERFDGAVIFKIDADRRISRSGRFLRNCGLDELPQLWNVLRGDMSLVGPRPLLSDEFSKYGSVYFSRLNVAPGLTGLWQVEAGNTPSFEKYFSLDVQYIENWSLGLDLRILFKALSVVLMGTGS